MIFFSPSSPVSETLQLNISYHHLVQAKVTTHTIVQRLMASQETPYFDQSAVKGWLLNKSLTAFYRAYHDTY